MQLFSHVDVRVRDRNRARIFYDTLLAPLGAVREDGPTFMTYQIPPPLESNDFAFPFSGNQAAPAAAPEPWRDQWFGFTEDRDAQPGGNRIAFAVPTREIVDDVARRLLTIGATSIERSEGTYGPDYYAVFFSDPDGNSLEVCCVGPETPAA